MHVVFVCTGNICRSPTAERLAVAYATERGLDVTASSAGTRAVVGHPVEENAARVLQSLGGSPDEFVARRLTPAIANDADVVLTMTTRHRDEVLKVAPRLLRRTFTLLEAAELADRTRSTDPAEWYEARVGRPVETVDIDDPIGRDLETFERIGTQIAGAVARALRVGASGAREC